MARLLDVALVLADDPLRPNNATFYVQDFALTRAILVSEGIRLPFAIIITHELSPRHATKTLIDYDNSSEIWAVVIKKYATAILQYSRTALGDGLNRPSAGSGERHGPVGEIDTVLVDGLYGPAVRRKSLHRIGGVGVASMYSPFDWSARCSGPPWISARMRSHPAD